MIDPKNTFWTLSQIHKAAYAWYGRIDRDSCCLAEVRLMKGEAPPEKRKKNA